MFVPLTPIRCLHRAVDLFGKKVGIVSGERQFTYAEFGAALRTAGHRASRKKASSTAIASPI